MNATLRPTGELSALLIRKDGTHREALLSRETLDAKVLSRKLLAPLSFWKRTYHKLRASHALPIGITFAAFLHAVHTNDFSSFSQALVTTAGINYLAADFLSASSNRINAFNYQDSGTGATAAAIGDTVITAAGPARVAGTQSTPSAGQYRSIATIAYTGTLAITEWGLFSASTSGTLWDRRVFSAINVLNGDSITFTYNLTATAGGS